MKRASGRHEGCREQRECLIRRSPLSSVLGSPASPGAGPALPASPPAPLPSAPQVGGSSSQWHRQRNFNEVEKVISGLRLSVRLPSSAPLHPLSAPGPPPLGVCARGQLSLFPSQEAVPGPFACRRNRGCCPPPPLAGPKAFFRHAPYACRASGITVLQALPRFAAQTPASTPLPSALSTSLAEPRVQCETSHSLG